MKLLRTTALTGALLAAGVSGIPASAQAAWGWHGGWGWGGAGIGLAAGAIIGSAIAASNYGYGNYAPGYGYPQAYGYDYPSSYYGDYASYYSYGYAPAYQTYGYAPAVTYGYAYEPYQPIRHWGYARAYGPHLYASYRAVRHYRHWH